MTGGGGAAGGGAPELTARQLNRATLERQMLLRRVYREVPDAVRELAALQAQEAASPYLALWNRISGFDPAALDRAFADRAVVKATLMRMTLHAVHHQDYAAFYAAMRARLRSGRVGDDRFTVGGLTGDQADALIPALRSFAGKQQRTGVEIEAHVAQQLGGPRQGVWWALKTYAPLHHAPTGGPWGFRGRLAFRAADRAWERVTREQGAQLLAQRYLAAFGPAGVADFAQFTLLTQGVARAAMESVGTVRYRGPGGRELFDVPGKTVPPEDTPAPARLLPMWDSTLLAYRERDRIVPPQYRPVVIRRNGNVLPTILVDGQVAGVWRVLGDAVEVSAFHRLPASAWAELSTESAALLDFLGERDPRVYGAYHHWWVKGIDAAELRTLP
ncbi:AlkZ family DNA glycosylase [Kineosporia sp. J2-2]|uniref:AlkZ family DNA glycosylase n=1 Tax=Kineosporia corallincola TaxID=2835133 RepID=A0ABS5TI27_9ACTN|nr:winged helix DNA-binding domain-containing protein [Kineosporia corallincola]MBT0770745.1 AlkZ family DNA glycosylase [Kineosporia corallincola]